MARLRLGKIDLNWGLQSCHLMFNGIKFLPYTQVIQGSSGEFTRISNRIFCDTSWYRRSEDEEEDDFHVAQIWHGDDGKFHIAGQYSAVFDTIEEAQKCLDQCIVEYGGIIIPDKMVPFL